MFIRKVRKTDKDTGKSYFYYQLVESFRTEKGPRQRIVLNLGKLELEKKELRQLANRIEEILKGILRLIPADEKIEKLARKYASLIRKNRLLDDRVEDREERFATVDLESVKSNDIRSVGPELIGKYAYEKLGMRDILKGCGFKDKELDRACILILGKLLYPGSEREIYNWYKNLSGLEEVMNIRSNISLPGLYRISDKLLSNKDYIEKELVKKEREIYNLNEKLVLFDLTNTYFEGAKASSDICKRGRSKDKRYDRPLVSVGIVIDEDGFPKTSRVYSGNISEPGTLKKILKEFSRDESIYNILTNQKKTVVIDAGIATEENLKLIREYGLEYICVDRRRVKEIPDKEEEEIDLKSTKLRVIRDEDSKEVYLYCKSEGRLQKEESIKNKFQQGFEFELKKLKEGLHKKGRIKRYDKVLEKIGRLKEKYSLISHYYNIEVKSKDNKAIDITYSIKDNKKLYLRFSGAYKIRSSRTDLSTKELISTYMLLTNIERSFRSLKQDLSLRPVYHRLDSRIKSHIFLTILAYHLLNLITRELTRKDIMHAFSTIRRYMSTLCVLTTTMRTIENRTIYIRQVSKPESFHIEVLNALGISIHQVKRRIKITS